MSVTQKERGKKLFSMRRTEPSPLEISMNSKHLFTVSEWWLVELKWSNKVESPRFTWSTANRMRWASAATATALLRSSPYVLTSDSSQQTPSLLLSLSVSLSFFLAPLTSLASSPVTSTNYPSHRSIATFIKSSVTHVMCQRPYEN